MEKPSLQDKTDDEEPKATRIPRDTLRVNRGTKRHSHDVEEGPAVRRKGPATRQGCQP